MFQGFFVQRRASCGTNTKAERVQNLIVRARVAAYVNEIEVLSDDIVLNAKLGRALCGDCQNIGEGVIMAVIPVAWLLYTLLLATLHGYRE